MLNVNDLQKDTMFILDGVPYRVLEVDHKKVARQGASVQTKLKNLISGATLSRNFTGADKFEEAEIDKKTLTFLYGHRGEYVFIEPDDKSVRFTLKEDDLGPEKDYLKPNLEVVAEFFDEKIIRIIVPVKVDYKVVEAPPGVKGDTVSGGTKQVKIESGAMIQTPLFIEMDDVIRVNTERGEYAERVKKGK